MFATGMLLGGACGQRCGPVVGWEFVGLSSALLVGFFHERPAPVANALRVLSVYRISDAAMLSAAVLLRHVAGTDSLALLFSGVRTLSHVGLTQASATMIAVLLIVAVAGKSALLPFSGSPPRAIGGTDAVERRLLRLALDSRRLFPVAAVGTAARTFARGPSARRRIGRHDSDLRGGHDARAERRQIVAGLCRAHAENEGSSSSRLRSGGTHWRSSIWLDMPVFDCCSFSARRMSSTTCTEWKTRSNRPAMASGTSNR